MSFSKLDKQMVGRFAKEQCIDYHECVRRDPTWATQGNIYEGISELYRKFRSWALKQGKRPCKQSVFFNIIQNEIFPKD